MLLNRKKVRFYARIIAVCTALLMIGFFTVTLVPGQFDKRNTNANQSQQQGASTVEQAEADKKAAEESIKPLQEEVAKNPKDKDLMLALANAFADAGRYKEAVEAYQKLLALDPTNVNAKVDMGSSYFNSGDIDNAITAFKQGTEMDSSHPTAWYNLGIALAQKGDNKSAIGAWKKFLALQPKDPRAKDIRNKIAAMEQEIQEKSNEK